jgi:mono/diheme cytochrome c family protein
MIVRFHMHENYGLLRAIDHLLVRGKLDEAKDLARGLAASPDEPGMAAFATQTATVRDQATAIANATTTEAALRALTKVGGACASCHAASGTLPDLGTPPAAPPDRTTVDARMARHRWATDRLWEGVMGLSDEGWAAGLDVLVATPLPGTELGSARQPFARTLQRDARRARTVKAGERAAAYGDLLVTCAACHATR